MVQEANKDSNVSMPKSTTNTTRSSNQKRESQMNVSDKNASLKNSIDKFKQYLNQLHEIEYGDFKRKLSLYIMRLEESLPSDDILSKRVIATMRERIIYSPKADIDIDVAKMEVLDLVKRLEKN